jgi:hypothetical protein
MADQTTPSLATTHDLLATTRALTRRVRSAQRGAWFPLALFGLATLAAAPFERYGGFSRTCTSPNATGYVCSVYSSWSFVYWPTVLVLIYIAIAGFYARHAHERGVGTRVKPYVVVGIIVAVVLTAASLWVAKHPSTSGDMFGLRARPGYAVFGLPLRPGSPLWASINRLVSPGAAIGLALLVLARIERNVALLVFTLGYLAIVLLSVNFGWVVRHPSPWFFVPHLVVAGMVLLLGSLGFALAGRDVGRDVVPSTEQPTP